MILVNNADAGGGPFAILEHAAWNGVTIADFVMPSFLFMVGMAIPLALKNVHRIDSPEGKLGYLKKALVRAAKLIGLGLLLHFPRYNLKTIRLPGVLQRIGVCYLLASVVVIFLPPFKRGSGRLFSVFTNYLWYWITSLIIMVIYIAVMFGVQVPGCPSRGMLTPPCNAAGWLDVKILTPSHMYAYPTCHEANPPCEYFDPEGLLSTFVATCSVFIGLYYGYVLQQFQFHSQRVVQWVVPSLLQLALGFTIHFTFMPFNKNLYSISYIFLMGGTAGLVFILCYIMMDVAKFQWPGMPFVWLGSNSIILYCGDDLLPVLIGPSGFVLIYYGAMENNFGSWARGTFFDSWLPQYTANLVWALCRACFWMIPAFILFRKKIFVRV
eukprot:TRINITY_DN414_c0_g1_i4.p1 TRINITY_DN414_c0_g1~~TRINITY_DN414_c0_g1_i4.p1  ORF type:complete len:382 (-),score=20.92 TRINITY_DN414_c0_g1_i4:127-1272(-)